MLDHIKTITEALAASRQRAGLSQETIAGRAGLRQAYLSKIERAKIDPRLSTVMDIARAENLELMLIPAEIVPAVRALIGTGPAPEDRPLFSIEPE